MDNFVDHAEKYFEKFESIHEDEIIKGKYKNAHGLFSWLVEAFTYTKILPDAFYENQISLLYGEALKRMRSSSILARKGYFSDGLSLLRSSFELMKAINLIQNGSVSVAEYLTGFINEKYGDKVDFMKIADDHAKKMDNISNKYDNKDIPDRLLPSLRIFKDSMHRSTHKSLYNVYINLIEQHKEGRSHPFDVDEPIFLFENYFNSFTFVLIMYLRNIVNSNYLTVIDIILFKERISDLEKSYSLMDKIFHKDMIDYIKIKYKFI